MRFLIIFLCLLLMGCGNSDLTPISTNTTTGYVEQVRGALETKISIVSFSDTPNPYSQQQVYDLAVKLNNFVARNSSGLAWVNYEIENISIPQTQAEYKKVDYMHPTLPTPSHPMQQDCVNASPLKRYNVFITPYEPLLDLGWYGDKDGKRYGWCFLCADARGPDRLPLPHEFGHMFGLVHQNTGVMNGVEDYLENDYNGWYDNESLRVLGWPVR